MPPGFVRREELRSRRPCGTRIATQRTDQCIVGCLVASAKNPQSDALREHMSTPLAPCMPAADFRQEARKRTSQDSDVLDGSATYAVASPRLSASRADSLPALMRPGAQRQDGLRCRRERRVSKPALGTASGLAAAGIWGGMYVVSKVLLDIIPPFTLIACRLLLGSLTLASRWRGAAGRQSSCAFLEDLRCRRHRVWNFVWASNSSAPSSPPPANGSLVTCATPMFILPIAWVVLHERITTARLIALIISTMGVVAVLDPAKRGTKCTTVLGQSRACRRRADLGAVFGAWSGQSRGRWTS